MQSKNKERSEWYAGILRVSAEFFAECRILIYGSFIFSESK